MRMSVTAVLAAAVAGVAALAANGAATATYADTLIGTEVPPITTTLGTFVGIASGQLPAAWRVQIRHAPLATGATVAITGGTFSLLTRSRRALTGTVTGGSVAVTNRGSGCTDQTYHVVVTLSSGSFDGVLTHHRRSLLGRCLVYSATIRGHAGFTL
jgi:hypothetical protein